MYVSSASPYVRKVQVCAAELGLVIEPLGQKVHPIERDMAVVAANPMGQLPTFFADDGTVLYDSAVICEYLDHQAGGRLFPPPGPQRWRALVEHALADGLLGSALLLRYESWIRPEAQRHPPWMTAQEAKIGSALDRMEEWAPAFGDRVDIGTIAIGCAVGYLDLRFPALAWRSGRPALTSWFERFGARPSMQASFPS